MLINLSNHPSTNWPENQISRAVELYEQIEDLAFPIIDPNWSSEEVTQLVESYLQKIQRLNPTAVHVMGELTFTYQMVARLKSIGIPSIASTTERKVIQSGNQKISEFIFVQFRPY